MNGPPWYPQFLIEQFVKGRLSPGWATQFNLHDEEDKDYFEMLEEYRLAGKFQVDPW